MVYEWTPGTRFQSQWVWLSIEGVPLHAWDESHFASIGELWGEVIGVHQATRSVQMLERGVVLVCVPFEKELSHISLLNVDNLNLASLLTFPLTI